MAWGGLGLTTTRDVRQGYVQLIKCIANGGTFTLSLNNQETTPIRHDANATDITKALLALSMVKEVVVAFGTGRTTICETPTSHADLPDATRIDPDPFFLSSAKISFATIAGDPEMVQTLLSNGDALTIDEPQVTTTRGTASAMLTTYAAPFLERGDVLFVNGT
jgi:hypothetical protein